LSHRLSLDLTEIRDAAHDIGQMRQQAETIAAMRSNGLTPAAVLKAAGANS